MPKNTRLCSLAGTLLFAFVLNGCQEALSDYPHQTVSRDLDSSDSAYLKNRIIGGEEVHPADPIASSTVALYVTKDTDPQGVDNICTGTLVHPRVVLTAAHCFLDVAQGYLRIPLEQFIARARIGFGLPVVQQQQHPEVAFRKIAKVLLHPDYRAGMVRRAMKVPMPDVALILLDEIAPTTAQPAVLGYDSSLIKKDQVITLAGYGVTEANLSAKPRQLMKVQVAIHNPQLTSAQFSYRVINRKSACFADSGGPAYIEREPGSYVVAGITSWGDPECSRMGVYTSVPAFADFIQQSLESLLAEQTY